MSTSTIQFNCRTSSAKNFVSVFSDGAGDTEALHSRVMTARHHHTLQGHDHIDRDRTGILPDWVCVGRFRSAT